MLIRYPESVAMIAIEDGAAILVVQPRPGADEHTFELPAGCLEPGESPAEAATRELREECSLKARSWRELGSFWAAPAYSTERVHAFEARELEPWPGVPDADEEIAVKRVPLIDLPEALSDATSIAAYALWAKGGSR
ncbi:MAG TPA: NUDIX hydrolase [Thermoleophilaceae bacterium]|nr:NUDIX hydrolase [Thermoleophilaceae bacterium]